MQPNLKILIVFPFLSLAACAHQSVPDKRFAGNFQIGKVQVIVPTSEGSEVVANAIEASFRNVIRSYGPADSRLPVQNLTVSLRKPSYRDQGLFRLSTSRIRGRVQIGSGQNYPSFGFNYSEDPREFWTNGVPLTSKTYFTRHNTFTRLGNLLALDVVGRVRGAAISKRGRARPSKEVLQRLSSIQHSTQHNGSVKQANTTESDVSYIPQKSKARRLGATPPPIPN